MNNKLKVSRITIVCTLCAMVAMPAFSASSVRSLGGAGTYNGTANAAVAKSGGDSAGVARAGSMRVNNVAGATSGAARAGSTRAATTPRLSIGKYLSGSSAISGGSSVSGSHAGKPGVGTPAGDVKYLEEFVGYTVNGDTVPEQLTEIKLDVESLRADVESVTGFVSDIAFDEATGVLTVTVEGEKPVEYPLANYFDGELKSVEDKVEALQAVLDDVVDNYYTKSDVDMLLEGYAKKSELTDAESRLEAAIEAVEVPDLDAYLTKEVAEQTYAAKTEIETQVGEQVADLLEPEGQVSTYVTERIVEALTNYEVQDNSITVEKIADGAVTADKINTGSNNQGEMMMLMSNGDGTSTWVAVTVDAE